MRKIRQRPVYISIQTKLLCIFLIASAVIFGVNMYIYLNIDRMIAQIDTVYESNAVLNELQSGLNQVQHNMESFLDIEDTESIEGYLRSQQEFQNILHQLNDKILGDENKIAEKNVKNLSKQYMEVADNAIKAKRGRNVVRYKQYYETAAKLNSYINTYIYSLNNKQFLDNSDNYKILLSSIQYSKTVNIFVLCMVSVLSAMLIIFLTRGITNPLKRLAEAANEVAEGKLEVELTDLVLTDEVSTVNKAFKQMIISLRNNIEQIKKSMELESALKENQLMMETHLKDAQLKYLQAQINPHFLFNTLNAGAQLAMMEGADRTYLYVQNVADFFRYNIKKNNEIVTLREEIKLVDHYIYIINARFSGEIIFNKQINEELIDATLPGMILQPLVENAISHGVREIDWEKNIQLSIQGTKEGISIRIQDNGVGMSQEKIQRIMQGMLTKADLSESSGGVGLYNVMQRLRLYFGREDVFRITSEGEGKGTEAEILIPIASPTI